MPSERLTKQQYDNLQKLQDNAGKVPANLLPQGLSETCTPAAMGAPYQLGALALYPATLETFGILNAINSPFIDESIKEEDITIQSVASAVFVFCCAPEALRPVMAISQRRDAVKQTQAIAEKDPGFYEVYLRKLDELAQVQAEFNAETLNFYSQAGPVTLEDSVGVIMRILRDAMDGFTLLPEEGAKKKQAESMT